jgi:hypothetical protein
MRIAIEAGTHSPWASIGARLPKCPARSFHKRASEHIPEALMPALDPILEQK